MSGPYFVREARPDEVHERRPRTYSTCCGLVTHWLDEDRNARPVPGVREATDEERVTLRPCRACEHWQARGRSERQVVDVDPHRGSDGVTLREVRS